MINRLEELYETTLCAVVALFLLLCGWAGIE